jgi:hypothetical protein
MRGEYYCWPYLSMLPHAVEGVPKIYVYLSSPGTLNQSRAGLDQTDERID